MKHLAVADSAPLLRPLKALRPALFRLRHSVLAGLLAGALVAVANAAPPKTSKPPVPAWKAGEPVGSFRLVIVEKPNVRKLDVFREALRATCSPKAHCNVLFIDARIADGIRAMPEREQREKALLVYTTNHGFEWNCKFRPDADNCFTWN